MKLKKLAAVCVWVGLFVVLALLASGCSASSDDSEHAQTQAQDGADSEKDSAAAETENNNAASQDEEPALSEEAKGLLQFSPIKKGETYAIIKVKGYGSMTFKFFKAEAPKAVENFIALAKEDYYDGVTFHRVLEDFMIQGGDPTGTGSGGESSYGENFEDEFSDELEPYRGALCMANSGKNTNGSQFFIVQADAASVQNLKDLIEERYDGVTFLDYLSKAYDTTITSDQEAMFLKYGGAPWLVGHHTVFGQLMDGYDVLDAIAACKTDDNGKPQTDVVIEDVQILEK